MALVQLTHWIFMLQKRCRFSGFCVSALVPPLRQGKRAAMPRDGSGDGSQASHRRNGDEVLHGTPRLCRIAAAAFPLNAPREIKLPGKQYEAFTQPAKSLLLFRHQLVKPFTNSQPRKHLSPILKKGKQPRRGATQDESQSQRQNRAKRFPFSFLLETQVSALPHSRERHPGVRLPALTKALRWAAHAGAEVWAGGQAATSLAAAWDRRPVQQLTLQKQQRGGKSSRGCQAC